MKKNKKPSREFSNDVIIGLGAGTNVIGGGTAVIRDKTPSLRAMSREIGRANEIVTDPLGSWTGVPTEDPYEKPIQDADDL